MEDSTMISSTVRNTRIIRLMPLLVCIAMGIVARSAMAGPVSPIVEKCLSAADVRDGAYDKETELSAGMVLRLDKVDGKQALKIGLAMKEKGDAFFSKTLPSKDGKLVCIKIRGDISAGICMDGNPDFNGKGVRLELHTADEPDESNRVKISGTTFCVGAAQMYYHSKTPKTK